jgi:hypothetical protein
MMRAKRAETLASYGSLQQPFGSAQNEPRTARVPRIRAAQL